MKYLYWIFSSGQFPKIERINGYCAQEEELGQFIADSIEASGIKVSFESFTDWGYVFNIKIEREKYIIYLTNIDPIEKEFGICIESKSKGINPKLVDLINSILKSHNQIFNICILSKDEWNTKYNGCEIWSLN